MSIANKVKRALTGRKIVAVKLHASRNGRGGFFYRPIFDLDNGTSIAFSVQETEVGEYGVEPYLVTESGRPLRDDELVYVGRKS